MLSYIRATLLELESIRSWQKNPDNYSSGITSSAFTIMSRKFAPPEARLRSLIEREKHMPKVLADARENLSNPPRIYTEIAIEQLPGNIDFFKNDVPLAFKDVTDRKLLADFKASNQAVIAALQQYETFLKKDLLPRSSGDFRLGAENYSKKLLYEEMVDIPLDRLLEIGYANLRENQQKLRETAAKIDPRQAAACKCWRIWKRTTRRRPICSHAFRDTVTKLRDSSTRSTSSPSLRPFCRSWRRRRRSCAR